MQLVPRLDIAVIGHIKFWKEPIQGTMKGRQAVPFFVLFK